MTFTMESLYSAGYAHPEYNISDKYDCWRFRDEHYKTPKDIVRHFKPEWPCGMAKIEDVRKLEIK